MAAFKTYAISVSELTNARRACKAERRVLQYAINPSFSVWCQRRDRPLTRTALCIVHEENSSENI